MFRNIFVNYPFPPYFFPMIIVLAIFDLIIKGFALYRAARNKQKVWFVCLLIFNTVGILPAIYLLLPKGKNKKRINK